MANVADGDCEGLFQAEVAKGLTNPLPAKDHQGWRGIFSVK